jgi:Putative neutral zinc metallopeptidase
MTRFLKRHKKRLVINCQKRADLSPAIRPHDCPRSSSYPYRNIVDQRFDPQGCGRFELDQCGPGLNCFPMSATIRCDQSILFRRGRAMRIDELPQSERIEDRRGASSGLPGGRGGIGIGTIVVLGLIGWALGIDPRLLIGGAEMISGGDTQQQADVGSAPKNRSAIRRNGALCIGGSWKRRSPMERHLCPIGESLQTANAGHVFRSNTIRLWLCAIRDGTVLLPVGSKGLPRHKFLSGS